MPESKYYVVTRTQTVGVIANSATDAIRIGESAFEKGQTGRKLTHPPEDVWGNTTDRVSTIEMNVRGR